VALWLFAKRAKADGWDDTGDVASQGRFHVPNGNVSGLPNRCALPQSSFT